MKTNSARAWVPAVRPKTLAAGSVPVMVTSALSADFHAFRPVPSVLSLLFALFAQIASNFSNDYFDFVKKTDNKDRPGPPRAMASG